MIPRVFVSSTYFDLKHVRERIEKFIENYGFEPILFESDKVTYQHEKEIDHSAYYEVGLCHIMVLIVGGRYGSPTSKKKQDEERKKYDENYISITRKEFETATQKNIPVLIFVDKNVHGEYQTYKENQEYFDELYSSKTKESKDQKIFKFAHVDHINVFKFIDLIRTKPIKTFEKVEEIESYIKSQLSGMFYLYLESLKKESYDSKVLDTVAELNNITLRMNEMLTSVGKEILGKDKKEFEKVIENQLKIMISFFIDNFRKSIDFVDEYKISKTDSKKIDFDKITNLIYNITLKDNNTKILSGIGDADLPISVLEAKVIIYLNEEISKIADRIIIKQFNFLGQNRAFHKKVLPFLITTNDKKQFYEALKNSIRFRIEELPF